MAPKKSERLRQKSFKTKPSDVPLVIHDESSDSEKTPSQSSSPPTTREVRSKISQDSSKQPKASDKHPETPSEPIVKKPSGLESSRKSPDKEKKSSLSRKGKEKIESGQGSSKSKGSKQTEITPIARSASRKKSEVCACSFVDFNFFDSNGFYMTEFLGKIGCVKLCSVQMIVYGEYIKEFYENLSVSPDNVLTSKVNRQTLTISKQDISQCFDMEEVNDDVEIVNLPRNDLFAAVNGGLEMDYGKEAMVMDFELLPRILHKIIIECICPRKGSSTSMSIEHAQIIFAMLKNKRVDIASRIIDQIWRNKDSMIFGNVLMKIFDFKRIQIPSSSSEPIKLKRIGKEILHHMSIYVKNYLWYTNDGSHFIDERHKARKIPFESSPTVKEAEASSEGVPEGEGGKSKKRKIGEVGEGSGKSSVNNVDFDFLKNLIKDTIKEEMISVQRLQKEKLDQQRSEFQKSLQNIEREINILRTLFDEFNDKVKTDLNNNVTAFDKLVHQMRKIGDTVTKWFDQLDVKTARSTQVVKDLQGEIQLFLKDQFPHYIRPGPTIIDLDPSSPKPTPSSSKSSRIKKS